MKLLANLYKRNYKKYLAVPITILFLASFLAFVSPGVPKGIDLSGGTLIIIRSEKALDAVEAKQILSKNFDLTDLSVVSTVSPLGGNGLTIRFAQNNIIANAEKEISLAKNALDSSPATALTHAKNAVRFLKGFISPNDLHELSTDPAKAVQQASELLIDAKENFNNKVQEIITKHFALGENVAFQKKEVSPTLGSAFYKTALNVGIFAVALIVIVTFLFFRKIVPSAAVIASAFLDVIGALGLMALFRIPLTLSSIPALLMLVGYSVDTDVMLTTKLLKRREQLPAERAYDALTTGLTMSFTTIAALIAMLALSFLSQMLVVYEIASVLLFGLLIDLPSTWFMNAPILLWYVEREEKGKKKWLS